MEVKLRQRACLFLVLRKKIFPVDENLEANLDPSQGWEKILSAPTITIKDISNWIIQSLKERRMWRRLGMKNLLLVLWKIYLVLMIFYQLLSLKHCHRISVFLIYGAPTLCVPIQNGSWHISRSMVEMFWWETKLICFVRLLEFVQLRFRCMVVSLGLWKMVSMYQS